ncbi:hypothetical protein DH2020_047131 [Rehmannia glutinosa]|uniref:FAD-binding FR-type domain-containing protein n=1 Tax=Rehmannia glutinosa TaxID=99300 RepID=A0ABR0U9A0_REHGL
MPPKTLHLLPAAMMPPSPPPTDATVDVLAADLEEELGAVPRLFDPEINRRFPFMGEYEEFMHARSKPSPSRPRHDDHSYYASSPPPPCDYHSSPSSPMRLFKRLFEISGHHIFLSAHSGPKICDYCDIIWDKLHDKDPEGTIYDPLKMENVPAKDLDKMVHIVKSDPRGWGNPKQTGEMLGAQVEMAMGWVKTRLRIKPVPVRGGSKPGEMGPEMGYGPIFEKPVGSEAGFFSRCQTIHLELEIIETPVKDCFEQIDSVSCGSSVLVQIESLIVRKLNKATIHKTIVKIRQRIAFSIFKYRQEPLLSRKEDVTGYAKNRPFLFSSAKWTLRVVMWVVFIAWAAFIFLYPSNFVSDLSQKWVKATQGTLFGITGSIFLIFSAPILLIAFLGTAYMIICGKEEIHGKKTSRFPSYRLWTFPVLVDGPFGVVSAAEMIGIVIFTVYVIWAFAALTVRNSEILSMFDLPSKEKSVLMLELTGLRLGLIGLFCLGFLFLPVARGSILLRLIDIPFEHATRYHVWLGHLTMVLFTLHGLFYVIGWAIEGRLIHELLEWKKIGIANLPGVISLVAGLLMWVTSLPGVRRVNFELFFYTHQLYVIFVVFLALHVGDFIFCFAAGGIFLFMLDRFLRFCQSRRTVSVLSARTFPCGTLELVLSKPANLHYNALGWVFLQVRELSWLQWHPFSVSSSPLDGKHHLAILIKVLGDWTQKLERRISSISEKEPQTEQLLRPYSEITASVGALWSRITLPFDVRGIGISPFLAILSDVLHRINEGKPCLPKNILIIWAVKTSDELPLLQTVDMDSICPTFSDSLNLEIQTYVTRQSEPSLEEGKAIEPVNSAVFPASKKCGISVLVGTGNIIWSGVYVIASTVGLVITVALLNILYINPYKVDCWWYKGLLFMACMVVSVLVFGGLVIGLWHLWERRTSVHEFEETIENGTLQQNGPKIQKSSGKEQYINTIRYGQRPDFRGIFESTSDRWGNVDIGVIVCGPPTLQTSVAKECRTQNLKRRGNQAIFHFNSHSFDL